MFPSYDAADLLNNQISDHQLDLPYTKMEPVKIRNKVYVKNKR